MPKTGVMLESVRILVKQGSFRAVFSQEDVPAATARQAILIIGCAIRNFFIYPMLSERMVAFMHIVLYEPEIPQNTGNIARTCAATGSILHLVKPLGFSLEDRYLKRAGLDYWKLVECHVHERFEELLEAYPGARMHFLSTKAPRGYTEAAYGPDDFLVFGRETRGLPESLLSRVYDRCLRIPMVPGARSLNLSNSVAIVLYEALRGLGFPGLLSQGALTGRADESAPWMDCV